MAAQPGPGTIVAAILLPPLGIFLARGLGADATVNVALGDQFTEIAALDKVTLDPAVPLPSPAGCTPYDQAAAPAATPAPSAG